MRSCPKDLQSDLCLNIHKVAFDSNKAFKHLSDQALRALSRYFWTIRTVPGDKLITTGEIVDTIYFVATGSLEVYSSTDLTGLIGINYNFWRQSYTLLGVLIQFYFSNIRNHFKLVFSLQDLMMLGGNALPITNNADQCTTYARAHFVLSIA